jgi:hypothetical protein
MPAIKTSNNKGGAACINYSNLIDASDFCAFEHSKELTMDQDSMVKLMMPTL